MSDEKTPPAPVHPLVASLSTPPSITTSPTVSTSSSVGVSNPTPVAKTEAEIKADKQAKLADLHKQIATKKAEYDKAVLKSEGDKAKFAADEAAKLDKPKQELDKMNGEVTKLVEALKVESPHARILREHGGLESNIPINSEYWRIRP